jgi:hypothetical protein
VFLLVDRRKPDVAVVGGDAEQGARRQQFSDVGRQRQGPVGGDYCELLAGAALGGDPTVADGDGAGE